MKRIVGPACDPFAIQRGRHFISRPAFGKITDSKYREPMPSLDQTTSCDSRRCLNCDEVAPGRFCAHCGQKTDTTRLTARQLVQSAGWRYIQYSALFFILWNLDAFTVHLLEEQLAIIDIQRSNLWQINITANNHSKALVWLYYFAKLDHLLCVPALLFLYFGLRRLLKKAEISTPRIVSS